MAESESRSLPKIECKCPKCEKLHIVCLEWSGIGVPRIYCKPCKVTLNGVSSTVIRRVTSGGRKSASE